MSVFRKMRQCEGDTVCRDDPYELTKVANNHYVACPLVCLPK